MRSTRLATLLLVACATASAAAAQLTPNETYVVTTTLGAFAVDRTSGSVSTLVLSGSAHRFRAVDMNRDNDTMNLLRVTTSGTSSDLVRLSSSGSLSTLQTFGDDAVAMTRNVVSQLAIATASGAILRTSGVDHRGPAATLTAAVRNPACVAIDADTGDYWIGDGASAHVLRRSAWTDSTSTLTATAAIPRAIAHHQPTGGLVAVSSTRLQLIDRGGNTLASQAIAGGRAVHCDANTGVIRVTTDAAITEYDAALTVLRTLPLPSIGTPTGFTVYGSRRIAPSTSASAREGTRVFVVGRVHSAPKATYVCALGLSGLRPGIPTPDGRTINLVPDALLLNTARGAVPVFTNGFVGITDTRGGFAANFIVPPVPLLHFTAVVIDPASPSGLAVQPTLPIPVRR